MVFIWITFLCVICAHCIEYRELQDMGVACSPRDTCRRTTTDFRDTNCECGRSCLSYNDCCIDGPKASRRRRPPQKLESLTCFPFLSDHGVYGISGCSNTWDGTTDVKSKCENHDDLSDPLMSVPVTDTERGVTYRNLYCAQCNAASTAGVTTWNLSIMCNSLSEKQSGYNNITEKFITENMVRVDNSWGVYHWNKRSGSTSFFPCELKFAIPSSITNSVRYCRPNLVSACASNWNSETVRKDCDSYMGVVYINGQGYRNAHCALCNHVSLESAMCTPPGQSDIELTRLSFSILLDINNKDAICSKQQVYDPFFKKCRRLICPTPGHVARNGKCVEN